MLARIMLAAVAALTFFSVPASAERRVALVIGNGAYKAATALPNTRNDAQAIAALLKAQQFEVISGVDLSKSAMSDKLLEFAKAASEADVALFFYAGHGIQVSGRNFLIPVDADLKSELHANLQAIDTDFVLNQTMGTAKVKLVLLDACRDNPFVGQIRRSMTTTRSVSVGAGLAEMKPGEGTLVAFATGPGQTALDGTGRHSPFTQALLDNVATPGLEIRHALTRVRAQVQEQTNKQQLPWENTNMTGFFFLAPGPGAEALATTGGIKADPTPSRDSGPDPRAIELTYWQAAENLKTAEGYRLYLEKYPSGEFAGMANAKLSALQSSSKVAALDTKVDASSPERSLAADDTNVKTESDLGLDRDGWRKVQEQLTGVGFRTTADGSVGDGTRSAIKKWQGARKYSGTGYLNKVQYAALMAEPHTAKADDEGKKRSYSSQNDEQPRRKSTQKQGGGSGDSAGSSTAIGTAIGIGAGFAIGRAFRRR